jgi:FAD/FMN-containing dehydrogenase/Fe-S oxidoreductase
MSNTKSREIPYNYTSADDRRIFALLLGTDVLAALERLVFKRRTGRSWRLLMRFIGDLFIHHRNPFLYQELIDNRQRRQHFISGLGRDLSLIARRGERSPDLKLVLDKCRKKLHVLTTELATAAHHRGRLQKQLGGVVGEQNVFFDPFTLIAHATDATDWRLHLPIAVVCPDKEEQVPLLLGIIADLKLKAIPRGGGTGLTGGAVPVAAGVVVINTEKMNRIGKIIPMNFEQADGAALKLTTLELEAGVITDAAMQTAQQAGMVFATDPTSAWACTIGGNVAENAGGKRAVLWGTAIDNLLSFRIAVPDGRLLEVRRNHPSGRRINPDETISFSVTDTAGAGSVKRIRIHGHQLRKPGLGKDITNKALQGLPGVQKEGTDGIITSAVFVLQQAYAHQGTVCLEFFGEDMDEAGRVISQISRAFVNRGREALMALEHFDEEYAQAIDYKAKAPRSLSPKAVLLIDIVGHTPGEIDTGLSRLRELLADYPNTFMAVAQSDDEAARFWRDRKRLGAIAARTNAFKLNEDIVLPIKALADFAAFVDDLNIEEERSNQVEIIWHLNAYLEKAEPLEDPQWLTAKLPKARQMLKEALAQIKLAGRERLRSETHLGRVTQSLSELLRGFSKLQSEIDEDIKDIRTRRIVVATHMHAGDGNVHVNIPVFSNDREMMRRATEVADIIMEKVVDLEGVVSGEHGIGFTKIKHLPHDLLVEFREYKHQADPDDVINPGKLTDPGIADQVYTPSFNLIELEARILRYGRLEKLAEKIAQCVRCGKCKTRCCVFYPAGNLFYHPRNKNLALMGIIEALLYDAQRSHAVGLRPLRWLGELADHCTLCHKCFSPCPVNIDTGEVSILEREVLAARGAKRTAMPTRIVLGYLASRLPLKNAVIRRSVLQWGGAMQRAGARMLGRMSRRNGKGSSLSALLYAPAPPIAAKPMSAVLPAHESNHAMVLMPDEEIQGTVLYFPGCGSERLHSDIGLAAIFLLLQSGTRVVLPPKYLCCGYPARANAKSDLNTRQELHNTIIFNQIRSMLGHLNFDGCIISCGTCREALMRIHVSKIFDAPLIDVAEYVLDRGLDVGMSGEVLYHQPCHDSLEGKGDWLLHQMSVDLVHNIPHCCSEAGTLALSRPDIAAAMFERKKGALTHLASAIADPVQIITNCPACLNGLGRQRIGSCKHLAVAMANAIAKGQWRKSVTKQLLDAQVIRF